MTLKRAPNAVKRGDGFTFVNRPSVALADTVVDGYEQNIIAQNIGPAGTRLTNVVSMNAHRASASDMFRGQALYLENAGPVALSGYAALFAGWQPGTDPRQRGGYFHGVYSNWGSGPLVIEDFILWGCAHSGAQLRAIAGIPAAGQQPQKLSAVLRRGVIIDCGSGVTAVAGNVALDDVVIYRGHRWHERDDRRNRDVWTGDIAVSAYTDTAMNDVLIVGGPGQDQPAYGEPATDARYDLGAVMGSRHYAPHPDVSGGAKWTVTGDCRIRAWPGVPFSGDAPCPAAGWRVDGRGPVAVNLDDLYRQLATGTRTVRDVRADLSKRIRDAAA